MKGAQVCKPILNIAGFLFILLFLWDAPFRSSTIDAVTYYAQKIKQASPNVEIRR